MILHLATLLFVLLKVGNLIHWSWWLIFMPSILAVSFGLFMVAIMAACAGVAAYVAVKS